ncbi:acetamidase/formamidase family protein [Dyella ginsengisoli]|uniref:Acetamidase/formamidase family protein n=1 Tax=Dyella ginsengisoli TaxID=363848 RepID=A0ABW8JYH3_9GAMM
MPTSLARTQRRVALAAAFCAYLLSVAIHAQASNAGATETGTTYTLPATPKTVAWGHYDATTRPVLRIHSGDTVVFHTVLTNSPSGLEKAGVAPKDVEQSLRDLFNGVPARDRGPGGHILTGPVYIDGAEPGDTLEIRLKQIDLAIPYAYNGFRYGLGFQTDDFPYSRIKIIPLDLTRRTAHFGPGIEIPLHPFFGSMGVAPPPDFGRYDSAPPTIIGGNMDNKELVQGSRVFYPVFVPGALFQIGDGHAGQGNGEVDITAMETSLVGTVQFVVHKGMKTGPYPRAETPTHFISMGFDDDLTVATHKAVAGMIDFLVQHQHLSRDDAYMLISVAGDIDITELVDHNKGVHVMLPKAIFTRHP